MPTFPELSPFLALVPAAAALAILQLRGGSKFESASSAATSRPQDPGKRSRLRWLARWRAQRGVGCGSGRWTLGYSNPIRATSLGLDDLRHHTLVCGATGSGKTSALQLMVDAFADQLPIVVVDCKASSTLQAHFAAIPNSYVWTIGGSLRWDPLRGDPTSVANRLVQGEWYSRDADVYRATAERYLLGVLQALDLAVVERTPEMVLRHLDPQVLWKLLRGLGRVPDAERLAAQVSRLGTTEHEGIAGFRARFGLVLEGAAAKSLGSGLALEDAIRARRPVLFSLDAATYPELATKLGAWILLDLVRVSALRPGPSVVIVDEFSALGREGRHVVPLLARTREAGMACVLARQGLADLTRVDANLPQQVTQNTAMRLVLRQGSAEDQQAWSRLLGGAPIAIDDSQYVRSERGWAVSPDELAMLRTGEAILQVAPRTSDGLRQRLWVVRPRKVGEIGTAFQSPEIQQAGRTTDAWVLSTHTKRGAGDDYATESALVSAMPNHGTGPGDRGGGTALGAAYDAADRTLVLRQSEDGDEQIGRADRPWLSEDDRHSVACTCDCHGDPEGSPSASRPEAAAEGARSRSVAARPDRSRSGSVDAGAGPAGRLDNRAGAAARRTGGSARSGGTAAARPGSAAGRSAGSSECDRGGDRGGADAEA
jgi:hypothetical protein